VAALLRNFGLKAEYRSKSMRTRRNHISGFNAKVALAAPKGDKALTEIAQRYDVYPNEATDWKRQLQERAAGAFDDGADTGKDESVQDLLDDILRLPGE